MKFRKLRANATFHNNYNYLSGLLRHASNQSGRIL
jgi:hypothetical protein